MKQFILIIGAVLLIAFFAVKGYNISQSNIEKKKAELLVSKKEEALALYDKMTLSFHKEHYGIATNMYNELEKKHSDFEKMAEVRELYNKVEKKKEEKLRTIEKERTIALNKLKKKHDDISGTTLYTQAYFTHYVNNNNVSLTIGTQNESSHTLSLMMSYAGSDWIFFKKVYLSYEGNTLEIEFDEYQNKKTDIYDGGICEWINIIPSGQQIVFLEKLAKSVDAKVRYSGKYTKDRKLTNNERKGISDIIQAYHALRAR